MDECLKRIEARSAGNERVTKREIVKKRKKREEKEQGTLALIRNSRVNSRFFNEFAVRSFSRFGKRAADLIHYRITKFRVYETKHQRMRGKSAVHIFFQIRRNSNAVYIVITLLFHDRPFGRFTLDRGFTLSAPLAANFHGDISRAALSSHLRDRAILLFDQWNRSRCKVLNLHEIKIIARRKWQSCIAIERQNSSKNYITYRVT